MIDEISIRDLGVIGEARLPLGPGFTALTGETGAGKTMVVTALGLLLGARGDAGVVRSGADRALVEGRWIVDPTGSAAERARDAGGELDEDELILARTVSAEGRSRAVVGGRSAPVGVLGELGEQLVVVHGQSDQVRLKSSTAQREALDRYAGPELASALAEYRSAFTAWNNARAELDRLTSARDDRAREADELRAAIAEIEQLAPQRGEDAELADRAERLGNLEDLRLAAAQAHELLSSESLDEARDAIGLIDAARRSVERVSAHDVQLGPIVEQLATAGYAVTEAATELSGYLASLETDGGRELEAVNERRAALTDLARRFGPSLDDVVELLDTGSARLLELDQDDDRIVSLTEEVERGARTVEALADRVTALRQAAAARLANAVTAEFAALAMPDARLTVAIDARDELTASGRDQVSLLLQPHAGAEPRPLGKGASGGELSRVMLALEVVIAETDPVPTFVFDEVDAGVGGASAIEIGRRLAKLAQSAQVIVVTHLAQVAAFATNHLTVVKGRDGTVTASSVTQLEGEARVAEMARLLSGLADSDTGLEHARELLTEARALAKA
ncbi:DNA replication and repair protein RecN [Microcella putealis]|uniref:DNA repair protein RecN n=1 Tax=Microcella putealis TaxID=337005 RepID=A0A4Q7LSP6_9MICO|nr:DNA repair protein RecN [Microcella putealis]RZS57694.1 DNA replication and repair protein RecN [Microcella putealis]TQM24761.1 DNA replication and repair protein RecN [Microcella putealis]